MGDYSQLPCTKCGIIQNINIGASRDKLQCWQCDSILMRRSRFTLRQREELLAALLFTIALLFILASFFPILNINFNGFTNQVSLYQCVVILYKQGMPFVSGLVFFTSIFAPVMQIALGFFYLFHRYNTEILKKSKMFRRMALVSRWGMLDVYMLGILISIVKVSESSSIELGVAVWAIGLLVFLQTFVQNILRKNLFEIGLQIGHHKNLDHSMALLTAALILLIPANLLPIMKVNYLGSETAETIVEGIIHLAHTGSWPLSVIIFVASLLVPFAKALTLLFLIIVAKTNYFKNSKFVTKLYVLTEIIGKWSMVDIYVSGLMAVLIQFQDLATSITIGNGALAFGAAVVLTILAVESFDAKLLWETKNYE